MKKNMGSADRVIRGIIGIAGQTAPGKGICIRNYTFGGLGGRDTIVRFIRLRLGNLSGQTMDGMGFASSDHCIIDHCSISWTIDEAFSSRVVQQSFRLSAQRFGFVQPARVRQLRKLVVRQRAPEKVRQPSGQGMVIQIVG